MSTGYSQSSPLAHCRDFAAPKRSGLRPRGSSATPVRIGPIASRIEWEGRPVLGAKTAVYNIGEKGLTLGAKRSLLRLFPNYVMSIEVKIRKNEPVERALRRLKKKLDREGVIKDVRANRYFEKPSQAKRRQKKIAAFNNMLRVKYDH